jgi:hypothetical protein
MKVIVVEAGDAVESTAVLYAASPPGPLSLAITA